MLPPQGAEKALWNGGAQEKGEEDEELQQCMEEAKEQEVEQRHEEARVEEE